jgi:undecaprenyl-diphosphatase
MNLFKAIVLGLIQGITEFFPVSSSGHLVIFEKLLNLPLEKMLEFDIAVHFASLIAIIIYFFDDFINIFKDFVTLFINKDFTVKTLKKNLFIYLFVASIPTIIFGLFFKIFLIDYFRLPFIVGIMMILTGFYFILAEKFAQKNSKNNLLKSFYIGISQAFAIIPGVSRSGITISTGIFLGLDRKESARFSFLLGSIAIWGATFLTIVESLKVGINIDWNFIFMGFLSSLFASLISIHYLIKIISKRSLNIFSIYLFVVGFLIILLT